MSEKGLSVSETVTNGHGSSKVSWNVEFVVWNELMPVVPEIVTV